jgi:hypothetical protein
MQDIALQLKLQSENKSFHVTIKKLHVRFSYISRSGLMPIPKNIKIPERKLLQDFTLKLKLQSETKSYM